MSDISAILAERAKTHGEFADVASVAQRVKSALRAAPGWADLSEQQRESLEMICNKMGRILSGDPNEPDHWRDISGYAELIARAVE